MNFNLSAWALRERTLTLFFIIASALIGLYAYFTLGRAEDPSFTIKTMTIQTNWPGATAREVEQLVTDPIEKSLEGLEHYDYTQSYSQPGQSVVFLTLRDDTPAAAVADQWYQARKKIGDIAASLPQGIQGPSFDDEFGDVYSMIYAFTGADFSPAELKRIAEEAREHLLTVPGVGKVVLIAPQDERIYVEISNRRLATLGLTALDVANTVSASNAVTPAGVTDAGADRIFLRIDDGLSTVDSVKALPIKVQGRMLALGDVADISRGYIDPLSYTMRYQNQDAIGLGVVMAKGGNVMALGEALTKAMDEVKTDLPLGVEVGVVADQAKVVEHSIGQFQHSLFEALAIVMVVSFISLGWRSGIVVALAVPLVLGITFGIMLWLKVDLQRVSSGALIISLGLLVDDAIIAVEMMMVKIEQGWDRLKAGAFAFTSTAFPMLTGTLVTAAGFVPVGLARSTTAEYTNSIFWVVVVSLLVSWVVAVLFTPYLGFYLLPRPKVAAHGDEHHAVYQSRLYTILRRLIEGVMRLRLLTVGITVALLVAAIIGFGLIQQQFFPSSNRPELLVDIRLAEGSSFDATRDEVTKMEAILKEDPGVSSWVAYTGGGTPRFYLPLDEQLINANFAQFVVMTKSIEDRDQVAARLKALIDTRFMAARVRIYPLENGPPVGYAVQFRVRGGDPTELRRIAYQVRDLMAAKPYLVNVNLDWDELAKSVRVQIDPAKTHALGVSSQSLAQALNLVYSGQTVTQYREGPRLIDVVLRMPKADREDLGRIGDINVPTDSGVLVPLRQLARIDYTFEEPILWRRSRLTTMTVRADVLGDLQAPVASERIDGELAAIRAALPAGYSIEMGGAIEESAKGQDSINAMMPLMLLIMLTAIMVQLRSFSRTALVLLTAPFGLIGVTAALLLSGKPFGFVAMLGVIALAGIIMRNSIILVDQIEQDIAAGAPPWLAIREATVRRARPIVLTAAAAILAMIPLSRDIFWGPMAIAIMGGLTVATLLTIFVLPALYALWFRVKRVEG